MFLTRAQVEAIRQEVMNDDSFCNPFGEVQSINPGVVIVEARNVVVPVEGDVNIKTVTVKRERAKRKQQRRPRVQSGRSSNVGHVRSSFEISCRLDQRSSSFVNFIIWRCGKERFGCQRLMNSCHGKTSALVFWCNRSLQFLSRGELARSNIARFPGIPGLQSGETVWTGMLVHRLIYGGCKEFLVQFGGNLREKSKVANDNH